MRLRIAYIGAGAFTNAFMYPQLHRHDIELAAVCDLDEEKAVRAQRRYGFGKTYTNFETMLDEVKPGAVFCVGGPKVHFPVGMRVLDAGIPLYVQKPPASTTAETRQMAEMAAKKRVVCHVGFNLRSSPAIRQTKRIMSLPEFGAPLMGIFRYGLASRPDIVFNAYDQHIHTFDMARYVMGEVTEIRITRSHLPEARDYVAVVRFESGAVGTINLTSGQSYEKEFNYFEVTGKGTMLYSHASTSLTWIRPVSAGSSVTAEPDHVWQHGNFGDEPRLEVLGYLDDVANFLAAARGEEEDRSPVGDSIPTMELTEEILRQVLDDRRPTESASPDSGSQLRQPAGAH